MVLPTKKLPAHLQPSTSSRRASPKPSKSKSRLQKTDLGELQSTPTKPPPPPPSPPNSNSKTLTISTILILLALLSVLYVLSPNQGNPICAHVSAAQEWAAPHLSPYLEKVRGYTERRIDELGAPYLALLRQVWERNIEPHVRTIWEKVQGQLQVNKTQ